MLVIVISGSSNEMQNELKKVMNVISFYMEKPIDFKVLAPKIREILKRKVLES
jgi:DNA-binding response OmpR family regulator